MENILPGAVRRVLPKDGVFSCNPKKEPAMWSEGDCSLKREWHEQGLWGAKEPGVIQEQEEATVAGT